jgi:hypothetical protein
MDPRRLRFRANLNRLYLPIYDFLAENLPQEWAPIRGFVTFDDWEGRYEVGRLNRRERIITNDKAGENPYNYGCASAWMIFDNGKPYGYMSTHDWSLYANFVEKAGGLWGGRFQGLRDKAHCELQIRRTWAQVNQVRLKEGFNAVEKYIEGNLCP